MMGMGQMQYEKQDEPPSDSENEKIEQKKELEIKANINFWESKGIDIKESEVRELIDTLPEAEGMEWYLVMPKSFDYRDAWNLAHEMVTGKEYTFMTNIEAEGTPLTRRYDKSYALATNFNRLPDQDSLGDNAKTPLDWEQTGKEFMNPLERIAYDLRYNFENKDQFPNKLDGGSNNVVTMCPGVRLTNGRVPFLSFHGTRIGIYSTPPDNRASSLGVREVITKDTPLEVIELHNKKAEQEKI